MFEEEEDQHPLYQHTKKENTLSSSEYLQYSSYYPCEEDTEVFRGLCFRDKSSFESFKKRLDNEEYFPMHPESFTRIKATAEDFARQRKTFFGWADENIIIENEYRKAAEECISGYAGIVIKCVIPKGKGLDVNKSEYAVEDEIVFMTDKPMKFEYEIVESYEELLKRNPVDINEYIQNNDLDDGLVKYLISNHKEDINKDTQHKILDKIIQPYSMKGKSSDMFLVDEEKDLVIGYERKVDLHSADLEISISTRPVFEFYKKGIFTDESVLDRIKDFSNHVIHATCEFIEIENVYGDRNKGFDIKYDSRNVAELSYFANDFAKERYQNVVHLSHPKNLDDLNDGIRNLNYREELSKEEINKEAIRMANEIREFLFEKADMMKKQDAKSIEKDIQSQNEKITRAKRNGRNLKNR